MERSSWSGSWRRSRHSSNRLPHGYTESESPLTHYGAGHSLPLSVLSRMTGFQKFCIVTCVVIFGLIVLGGVVRSTDSGLGCPDWPLCHGRLIPSTDTHTIIEWSHRTTASVVGFLVLGIVLKAFRQYRRVPAVLYPAVLAGVLLIFQAGLGGIAVLNELPPEVIMVHLGTALTILTLLMLVTITSMSIADRTPQISVKLSTARVAVLAAAGTLLLMLIGSYVAGAHYGLACSGWPLCNGEVVPSSGGASVQVHFGHRFLALLVGLVVAGLAWLTWKERKASPVAFTVAAGVGTLFVTQSIVGAANIWTELADWVPALHLALATLIWVLLAYLNIHVWRLHEALPRSAGEARQPGFAEVSR